MSLDPAKQHIVIIGSGGSGGRPHYSGQQGGDSALCENGTAVLLAQGGPGGVGAMSNESGGAGGRWRPSGVHDSELEGALQRRGHDGYPGSRPLFEYRGLGGRGGHPVNGTLEVEGAQGGNGGAGAMEHDSAQPGEAGGAGYAIVRW